MNLQEKLVDCFDCGVTFTFSPEEQAVFQQKGHTHVPKRCPTCRENRKIRQMNSMRGNQHLTDNRMELKLYPATCAQCAKITQVPFEPLQNRPVYCRECYQNIKNSRTAR